jgi:hypothetical protein
MTLHTFHAVSQHELVQRIRIVSRPTNAFENPTARLRVLEVERRLNHYDISRFDDDFTYQRFAHDGLANRSPVVLTKEVPVKELIVHENCIAGPNPHDTVTMLLQPTPELVKRHR